MKLQVFIFFSSLLLTTSAFSQNANCPPNIDFESGSFAHWDCFIGSVDTVNGANLITLNADSATPGRHELIDFNTAGFDYYGDFLEACPYGGRYSVKLGNTGVGKEAEGISYTFQIPPSADTFSLTYYYAVVFEDPSHDLIEQPRFFVSAYDVETGRVIDCASYNYVSTAAIPGFRRSVHNADVLYKEWTPSSIDFSGFSGRTVRLEFKTADCTRGGHFGYAYLDVGTGCGGVMALGAHCVNSDSVVLTAPYGFQSYTWYNANYTSVIGTSRLVTMRPPPPVSTMFHVDMVPYPGYGCRDTADAEVTILQLPDTPTTFDVAYCRGDYATQLKALPAGGHELLWYTSATGGIAATRAPIPSTAVIGSFYYWVSQRSLFGGCEGARKKMTVTISQTPVVSFGVNDDHQCQVGNHFIFNSTSTNTLPNAGYIWDFGDGDSAFLQSPGHTYASPGSYPVTLTVQNPGCKKTDYKYVAVIDKPVAAFSYPPVICENQTQVIFQNNSYVPGGMSPINTYWWLVGNTVSTTPVPTAFTAGAAGTLPVKLVITTEDGCRSDTATDVLGIHYFPIPTFSFNKGLCNNEVIQFRDLSYMPSTTDGQVVKWYWTYDNVPSSNLQNPAIILSAGIHHVGLQAESTMGCRSRIADSVLIVHPKPAIALNISDSCVFRDINYTASTTSPVTVNKWLWNFGHGLNEGNAVITRKFFQEDYNPVKLIGQTIYNCKDTIIRPFTIYYNRSKAERDTVAAKDEPVQLLTSKAVNMLWYKWSPSTGLSSTTAQNPVATYDLDQVYELNTLTVQGCDSYSKILVRRFKGPELYVANAFSPNNDSRNDILHIFPVGIRAFNYFRIYNRRGQLVFETNNYYVGWDGTFKGMLVDPENYVWMAMATDYKGAPLFRRGNVLVLR
ncbi:MAG: gliding motility-associated C-terminal domain-containing protein [Chitinophagaceae bacterium]|nr:gliding motility-associated C-terminal domain-containing protein [Chitinophagaceae bacterium]